jgi:hypothetical protein
MWIGHGRRDCWRWAARGVKSAAKSESLLVSEEHPLSGFSAPVGEESFQYRVSHYLSTKSIVDTLRQPPRIAETFCIVFVLNNLAQE